MNRHIPDDVEEVWTSISARYLAIRDPEPGQEVPESGHCWKLKTRRSHILGCFLDEWKCSSCGLTMTDERPASADPSVGQTPPEYSSCQKVLELKVQEMLTE